MVQNFFVTKPDDYMYNIKGTSDTSILAHVAQEPYKFTKILSMQET